MSFGYLWMNRYKPAFFSYSMPRVWAKRLTTMMSLIRSILVRKRLVYKGALIGPQTFLGKVSIIGKVSRLQVGDECAFGKVSIALHAGVHIGNRVVINDHVMLLTGTHDVSDPRWGLKTEGIKIGDYAWVAQGAIILPGITIGNGAVVGAGAVVTHDVPDYTIVVGNPAKPLKKQRVKDLNYSPVILMAPCNAWLARDRLDTRLDQSR